MFFSSSLITPTAEDANEETPKFKIGSKIKMCARDHRSIPSHPPKAIFQRAEENWKRQMIDKFSAWDFWYETQKAGYPVFFKLRINSG